MKKMNNFGELITFQSELSRQSDITKVYIGIATCGIAAGAKRSMEAMQDEIHKLGLKNIELVRVGCMGSCYAEPTFEVVAPNQPCVVYGYVDDDTAREIVRTHLAGNQILENKKIKKPGFEDNQVRIALRNCGTVARER